MPISYNTLFVKNCLKCLVKIWNSYSDVFLITKAYNYHYSLRLVLHILNFCGVFNQNYVIPVQKHLHHGQLPLMLSLALLKLSLPIKEKLYVGKCICGVKKKKTKPILHLLVKKIVCLVKDLLDYCPNDTLSAGRNCKRTNVSVILSAPKLNSSRVKDPQISLFFSNRLYVVEQLQKNGEGQKEINNQENI